MASLRDHWQAEEYQSAASFVPKLATKVLAWLNPQKNDAILDIGCGGVDSLYGPDGVLDLQIAQVISQGGGLVHGIDSSVDMISAANKARDAANAKQCTFQVCNGLKLGDQPELQQEGFDKVFSNAAMHWILKERSDHGTFFSSVRKALKPGGTFVFEMGGLGNVAEMTVAILMGIARRVGMRAAKDGNPWFFGDEEWVKKTMGDGTGGWKIEKIEREWRPTTADVAGVEGWVRLMGRQWLEVVPEHDREVCIKEIVDSLEVVCAKPGGGYMLSYVRLRVSARKV